MYLCLNLFKRNFFETLNQIDGKYPLQSCGVRGVEDTWFAFHCGRFMWSCDHGKHLNWPARATKKWFTPGGTWTDGRQESYIDWKNEKYSYWNDSSSEEIVKINFSEFLSEKLNHDYTYLAYLFSEVQGTTIEQFIISHKIERIKELIILWWIKHYWNCLKDELQ